MSPPAEATASAETVYRREHGRIIASLIRLSGSFDRAEEAMQEAFAAALRHWAERGVPDNPAAWIMTAAYRKLIDAKRRERTRREKQALLEHELAIEATEDPVLPEALSLEIPDDRLRLIFTCCHPALNREAQIALTLRTLGGLSTAEIARAFLVPESTVAQRIVRAKRTLSEAKVPFEVPRGAELEARVSTVLKVIYLIFNEGYSATAGDDWVRPALCEDALRLGRILTGLMPAAAEVHGLVALMEIQASRLRARVGPSGEPVLLLDQDRARWDQLLIRRGLAALARAEQLAESRGAYTLQAAIAACHARAHVAEETDWARIAALYEVLAGIVPSPVVELNRAVAVAMAAGPLAGLALVDALIAEPSLEGYHLLPSVRGDLLEKLGRVDEARAEFERAAALTRNARERDLLLARAAACTG